MGNPLLSVLAYILIPIIATVVGGITTIFWTLELRLKSAILHFAAGVVLVAITIELLLDKEATKASSRGLGPSLGAVFVVGSVD